MFDQSNVRQSFFKNMKLFNNRNLFRRARFLVLILLVTPVLASFAGAQSKERPNILFILADDMGYGDVSSFNDDSKIETPNIDRLAEEGRRFTDAHAPGSVCMPTRYGLLTGRYPMRSETYWSDGPMISSNRTTVPGLLSEAGYTTAMVGKWHLGFVGGTDYDYEHRLAGGPVDRGFDSYFGIPASLDIPPYFYIREDRAVVAPLLQVPERKPEDDHWTGIQGPFWRKGGIAPGFHHDDVLPRFQEEAISYITNYERNGPNDPFFMYLALPAPHTPWLPLKKYRNSGGAGMYGDFVRQVDGMVGNVLKTLERLDIKKETLVIFTSDNGPVWYKKDMKKFGHSATGPYRGQKGDAFEGGHRVPFIVRWPGYVSSGTTSDQLLSFTDLLATFSDLVDHELPEEEGLDSRSMLPAMLGEASGPIRETIVHEATGTRAVRSGSWKLIPTKGSGGFITEVPEDEQVSTPGQLYNLNTDPGEQNNLYAEKPQKVKELKKLLEEIKQSGSKK